MYPYYGFSNYFQLSVVVVVTCGHQSTLAQNRWLGQARSLAGQARAGHLLSACQARFIEKLTIHFVCWLQCVDYCAAEVVWECSCSLCDICTSLMPNLLLHFSQSMGCPNKFWQPVLGQAYCGHFLWACRMPWLKTLGLPCNCYFDDVYHACKDI